MRVYVASKFENSPEVRKVYELLQAAGHVITHDWTWESAEGKHGEELERYLRSCAEKDVNGVINCDVLLLINYRTGAGMFTELGIAIAKQKHIIVVDGRHPDKAHNIFFHLREVVHVHSIEEAVEAVNRYRDVTDTRKFLR